MPTWNEQLEKIDALRKERDGSAEQVYRTQIQLRSIAALLQRLKKGETSLPDNQQQIAALRSQIEGLQTQVRELNKQLIGLDTFFQQLKQNEQLIQFLQKKIIVVQAQLADAQRQLAEEEQKEEPDNKRVKALQQQIEDLQKLLPELKKNLSAAEQEGTRLRHEQEAALAKQKQLLATRDGLQRHIDSLQADLAGLLQQQNSVSMEELERQKKALEALYERFKAATTHAGIELDRAISQIYVDPHPRNAVANLSDNTPFLLLPLRIETRFMTGGRQPELWLRVYPDDIFIYTHEKLLTATELQQGIVYWKALFNAERGENEEKDALKKAAWSNIALLFGSSRATWVVLQTKPANWSDDLSGLEGEDDLQFPSPDLTKPDTWSRAPRVNVLPDKFVISLYQGETIAKEVVGNPIPDELFVGPDPMEADGGFVTKDDKLVFGESFDWTSDFEKAVSYGMGFKIPLTAEQATKGFDKILAFGVLLSARDTTAKKLTEDLISNHHYSPKGFSLVPQGTATNNMDDNGAGYTKNEDVVKEGFVTGEGKPLFTEEDDCDGKNLADALGIDYAPLQSVRHSNGQDLKEAVAMNTALYPSTLGYYFDAMLKPVLKESQQDKLRDFFVSHVTGRGPLPAIRVGDQPYGVLLTSNFEAWKWKVSTTGGVANYFFDYRFLEGLYGVLKAYNNLWKSVLPKLSFVGKNGADVSAMLLDIIGLQPTSASIYQRIGYSTDYLKNLADFKYSGKYYKDLQKNFTSKTGALNFLQQFGYGPDNKGVLKVPQLLRLVYQHYHTTLDAANIIDNEPLSEEDGITFYDEAAKKNYLHWLAAINSIDALEKQDFGTGKKAPTALLYMQLRRSLSLQLHKAAVLWFRKNNKALEFTMDAANFHNIRPGGDLTKWEVMRAKVGNAAPDHPHRAKPVSEYLLGIGRNEDEARFLTDVKNALSFLAPLPTARLERCFIEHLDTCNYRLDAWQTGLFHLRLQQQRRLQSGQRATGIFLGAYGWVENVRPSSKRKLVTEPVPEKLKPKNNKPLVEYTDNGGFVHAPSLNHASAAAVLRSGYMSHATPENPDVMAVNLSSERVRRAMFILDGMRNGQSLEALLGYQFERGLHDRGSADDNLKRLNAYIYDFREAFPLQHHVIQQQGTSTPQESIAANSVVNGVTLAEKTGGFPFGAKGPVASANNDERNAIIAEKDKLADTLDAVKDLLQAEGIYQVVQGNFERAGALANAMKDAKIPAELDVIKTPRGSHLSFTNRVTLHFGSLDAGDVANNPWPAIAMTPRAKMEAGLNKWLGKVLGKAEDLVFAVSYVDADDNLQGETLMSVAQLGLQPIDLVYITGNQLSTGVEEKSAVSELESRIAYEYRRAQGLDDTARVNIAFSKPANLAGKQPLSQVLPLLRQLKLLMTDSRYLHAKDFDPDSKKSLADKTNPKALDAPELLARVQQMQASFQLHLAAINNLPIQAEIPNPDAGGAITVYHNLHDAFSALDKAKKTFAEVSFTFNNADADTLQQTLITVSNFGLADAFPRFSSVLTSETKAAFLEQARSMVRRMAIADKTATDTLVKAAAATEVERKIEAYLQAGKTLLQEAFVILPLFTFNNTADVQLAKSDTPQLLKYATTNLGMTFPADEWMQNAAHVRPRLSRWDGVRSLYELNTENVLAVQPFQLPYRVKDNWLAVEFPKTDELTGEPFTIVHDTLSIVAHFTDGFDPSAKGAGLLLDDWTETIPQEEEMTGISFHYNQPNAMPPQALLLAVTPEEKGHWTWEDLLGILNDTLLRAKLRAVEPQHLDGLNKPELSVLRPALLADFSQYDLNVSLDYRLNLVLLAEALPIENAATRKN